MAEALPSRRYTLDTPIGVFYVDLWEGLFRDEVRIWKNVWPALGGLVGRRTCRHGKGRGDALHEDAMEALKTTLTECGFEITDEPAAHR